MLAQQAEWNLIPPESDTIMNKIAPSEITPEPLYRSRRQFITGMCSLLAGSALLSACSPAQSTPAPTEAAGAPMPTATPALVASAASDELGGRVTVFDSIANYANFYEFTTSKTAVANVAKDFVSTPWTIEVGGLVHNPRTFDLDNLRKLDVEERIYRMRCVEAWSMVIPWLGFPLSRLLDEVEPMSSAKIRLFRDVVRSQADARPAQRPLRVALRRGLASGRSHARSDHPVDRTVWQGPVATEWRAHPAGRALEIWVQEHQVDCENQSGGRDAGFTLDGSLSP